MNISISYQSEKPMYEQIKEGIKHAIYNGELKDNEALPSVRQLAADLDVSAITTKRAYIDLEHEGFIYTVSGKGTFVKLDNIKELKKQREEEIIQETKEKITRAKEIGISKDVLEKLLNEVWEDIDE